MAIIRLIFQKMLNNRWLTGSLFLGLIITVALVSSIPMYTSGVMQKLLVKELEDYQIKKGEFPGEFSFSDSFAPSVVKNPGKLIGKVESIKDEVVNSTGLPLVMDTNILATVPLRIRYEDEGRKDEAQNSGRLLTITGLEKEITIIDGTYPSPAQQDGVVEVLVSEQALIKRSMVLGNIFIVGDDKKDPFLIKPVGVFQPQAGDSLFWSIINQTFKDDFIVHEDWFRNEIIEHREEMLGISRFSAAFDYYAIENEHLPLLLRLESKMKSEISKEKKASVLFTFPIKDILKTYETKGNQMATMLWSLNVPVLIMLGLYLFMISRLIIERQLNEIAVFSSRGASRWQIVLIYFIEIAILGILALAIGPLLGQQLCKILGASSGFLEFVQRATLPVELSFKAYMYGLFAVLASVIMIMLPVYRATRKNIVSHKQQSSREGHGFKWYAVTFDFIVLGISIYGLYSFNRRQEQLAALDIESGDIMIAPELFFLPALFIIGFGLVALRIYPLFLKLVYKVGERFWSVSLYSTFLQVSRSTRQYQFLMLFLVMTIGIGVFSASAARTINTNMEEQLWYKNGAEVRMKLRWESSSTASSGFIPPMEGEPSQEETQPVDPNEIIPEAVVYTEPPFDPIHNMDSIGTATKVFQKEGVTIKAGDKHIYYSKLMGVEPKLFGETAWFKPTLLPHHWYEYLNLIASEPSAVLISKNAAESLGVKEGDYISLDWEGSDTGEFVVYGLIDYWPTYNPLETISDSTTEIPLVVANLSYVQNMLGLEPYEVWMKLKPDRTRAEFYQEIEDLKIPVVALNDVVPEVVDLKNSALLLGINGSMTLGFLISLLISFIGFLLYWILTIKSRTLQYGIYRAMGIPMPKLIGILVSEQILTSGFACLLGIIIGGVTSQLFVPFFKLSMNIKELMPPFTVVFDSSDEMKIYVFSAFMLIIGSAILIGFLRKIKIHQAIKLGED